MRFYGVHPSRGNPTKMFAREVVKSWHKNDKKKAIQNNYKEPTMEEWITGAIICTPIIIAMFICMR